MADTAKMAVARLLTPPGYALFRPFGPNKKKNVVSGQKKQNKGFYKMKILTHPKAFIGTLFVFVTFFALQLNSNAQDLPRWTFSMRIVANINENTEIIEEAKKTVGCDVYKDGKVVARWITVAKDRLGKFKIDESLPKRINKKGETEILALFNVKDVTENNVITIGNIMDENERIDLILVLNNAGASSFFEQTKNNNGRYISTIIDDYIYNIQKIISAIGSPSITIDGDFSLVWLKELCNRTPNIYMPGKEGDFTRNWLLPALFTIIPIACIIIIYILLFKLIKKGKVSIVTIGLCTMGSLVGAFQFGYSKYYIDNNAYNYFSILWFIVGALLGGFLMFIIYRLLLLLNKRLKFKDRL